ncbi:MAG: hypothetical protein HKN83_10720 [Gammaproteobacteria bacterium]|nr:hypothetical protein [Gammaproteobacteria bacterium]
MNEKIISRVHWSFWVISIVGLIFNIMGCLNYISQMNAEMVASMPDSVRAIIESRPVWSTVAFAIAVSGGALGAILLLIRKSVAYYLFITSLVGAVVAQIPLLGLTDSPAGVLIGGLSQLIVTVFLIWYSKWAKRKGWIS